MSADVWGDVTLHWTDRFRTTFGLRADYIDGEVNGLIPANAGSDSGVQWSPKVNGRLHAHATTSKSMPAPASASTPTTSSASCRRRTPSPAIRSIPPPFSRKPGRRGRRALGAELHLQPLRRRLRARFRFSELIYVGDAGISEPSDPTQRHGFEVAAFWNPVDWLAFDASYAYSHSRFKDAPSDFDRVPNTVEGVAAAGVTWLPGDGWEGSLRTRYLGPGPAARGQLRPRAVHHTGQRRNLEGSRQGSRSASTSSTCSMPKTTTWSISTRASSRARPHPWRTSTSTRSTRAPSS